MVAVAAVAVVAVVVVVVVVVVAVVVSGRIIRARFATTVSTRKLILALIVIGINLDFGESIYKIRLLHPLVSAIFPIIDFNDVVVNKRRDILHIFNVGLDNIHHSLCGGSLASMEC